MTLDEEDEIRKIEEDQDISQSVTGKTIRRPIITSASSSTPTSSTSASSSCSRRKRFKQTALNLFQKCSPWVSTPSDIENEENEEVVVPESNQEEEGAKEKQNVGPDSFISILDGKFFSVISKSTSKTNANVVQVIAKCEQCKKDVKGHLNSTSNFVKHMQRRHPGSLEAYEQHKKSKKIPIPVENTIQNYCISQKKKLTSANQKNVDERLITFFINTLSPFNLVENESFRALLDGEVMSRRTLVRKIEEIKIKVRTEMIQTLQKVSYLSVAADI